MSNKVFFPGNDSDAAGASGRGGVGQQRREQIIDAAIEIIATQGIPKLSLSNIESRVKMTRGHLSYYFPTKEAILLAVFDRMLRQMIEEKLAGDGPKPGTGKAWECIQAVLAETLNPIGPEKKAFLSLVHTFHAQIAFREDFRQKMAEAQANWRDEISTDYAQSVPDSPIRPEIAASMCIALIQGLSGQLSVDPHAFDREEMLTAIRWLIAPLFKSKTQPSKSSVQGESHE